MHGLSGDPRRGDRRQGDRYLGDPYRYPGTETTQLFTPASVWRGASAAVAVLSFDVDAETPLLAEDPRFEHHLSTMSHQAYGPKVGVPRILSMLARHAKPATFFFPGLTAERWPRTVEQVLEAGHEVALHGYTHTSPVDNTEQEQITELERGLAALDRFGIKPAGYRSPMWSIARCTLEALGTFGLTYDSSLFDDDRPYLLETPGGRLAELPIHWCLDDWEQYVYVPEPDLGHTINRPSEVAKLWIEELDAMRRTGSLCVLTCHPFASGRPSRLAAIERFIEFAEECGDVSFKRADEVARALLHVPEQQITTARPD
jgi:peptidoglycan/xylan/chitin deacetylase (PgdA/CDA1 family)